MDTVNSNGFTVEITFNGMSAPKHLMNGANYFSLPHRAEYKIKLSNNKSARADAHVYIDGEKMGVWRLNQYQLVSIERPVNDHKKFTFLKENTASAHEGGVVSGKSENGIIKVVFKPEKSYDEYDKYDEYDDLEYVTLSNDFRGNIQKKSKSDRGMSNSFEKSMSNQSYSNSTNSTNGTNGINGYTDGANFNESYSNSTNNNFSSGGTALGNVSHQQFQNTSALRDIDHDNVTTVIARLVIDDNFHLDTREFIPLSERTSIYPPRVTHEYSHKWVRSTCNCGGNCNCDPPLFCTKCNEKKDRRFSSQTCSGNSYKRFGNYLPPMFNH